MGQFEVDVIWIYILGGLIIIGVVVGVIICCCSGDKVPEQARKDKMEKNDMMMAKNDMMMADDMEKKAMMME